MTSPLPKDLKIEVKDSCNSKCMCCRTVKEDTPLYITTQGHAIKWDRAKVMDRQASMQRCLQNLDARIQEIAQKSMHDTQTFYQTIRGQIQDTLKEKDKITIQEITQVNKTIQSYFEH